MTALEYVGIAEYKLLNRPGILACSALGSCVGVCLCDGEKKLIGLLHALLPTARGDRAINNPLKYADTGIARLVDAMVNMGASKDRLRAKIVGGACLYQYEQFCLASEIGSQNVISARDTLNRLGIRIIAEHVGGEYGRSIHLNQSDFSVKVTVLSKGVIII